MARRMDKSHTLSLVSEETSFGRSPQGTLSLLFGI